MTHRLAPHVHAAVVGDDVVLLDVRADRYLCIPEGASILRPTRDRRSVLPLHAEALSALREAGLLGAPHEPASPVPPPALPTAGLEVGAPPRIRAVEALRLLACLWDVLRHYRGQPLTRILASVRPRRALPPANAAEVHRLAKVFEATAIWLPIPRKCLVRSFTLLRFLQRSGQSASWVFGVQTWPFEAHCWLQFDGVALDDAPERLAAFTPIMALEP